MKETEDKETDKNNTEDLNMDNDDDFITITKKRKQRSSPGQMSKEKKTSSQDEVEHDMIAELYKKMGLDRFIE